MVTKQVSQSAVHGTQLTFSLQRSGSMPGKPLSILEGAFGEDELEVSCHLARRGICIRVGDAVRLDCDTASGRALVTDLRGKRYLGERMIFRSPDTEKMAARATGQTRPCEAAPQHTLQRWEVQLGSDALEVWTLGDAIADARAVRRLWDLLLPSAPAALVASGLPADIIVRHPKDLAAVLGRVTLRRIERGPSPFTMTPPKGIEEVKADRPPEFGPGSVTGLDDKDEEGDPQALFARPLAGSLSEPADASWITAQPGLDLLETIVNTAAGMIEGFTDEEFVELGGRPGELGLVIDWWQQLETHLRGGPDPDTDEPPRPSPGGAGLAHARRGRPVEVLPPHRRPARRLSGSRIRRRPYRGGVPVPAAAAARSTWASAGPCRAGRGEPPSGRATRRGLPLGRRREAGSA